jgi:epoxyqueuosine reductase QueG
MDRVALTMRDDLGSQLKTRLFQAGATLVGFADIRDLAIAGFPRAVALAIAYHPEVVACLDTKVDRFERHLSETRERMKVLLEECGHFLQEQGFRTRVPEISRTLPGLVSEFSHKTAATKAGLGWIGKNALLVNPEYGCGFRLASVLTDAGFTTGVPVAESRCGECRCCQGACPHGAIRGVLWHPGIARDDLLDAHCCHVKREEAIPRLGYKHPCGLCIQACPFAKHPF